MPEQNTEFIEPEDIPTRKTKNKVYKNEKQKIDEERKDYVPIINPKITVEVQAKPRPTIEQIERIETPEQSEKEDQVEEGKGRTIEKIHRERKKTKLSVVEKVKKTRIETLKGNSILIITEKPQAAAKIASALSSGRERRYVEAGVSYYEFNKNNENVIVACAVGHLFSLSQDVKGSDYPIFEISWKPNFEVRKKDFTRKYYSLLSKLSKRAKEIIVATDYDVEGETIGYNIIRFIAHQKDAKRMKYSSLTKDELEEAFKKSSPTIDWGQAIAGETRHFIDWYYGINLSRALMNSIKAAGKFRIMSIGRVQGPTLKLIVDKEKEIMAFKPVPYWKIFIDVIEKKDRTNKARLRHIKDIFDENQLALFEKLKGREAEVKTDKSSQKIAPPAPFDLTTLQTEAYKFFYISPSKTLEIAQKLYLAGLISYPRTSSQKIPDAINPRGILEKLSKHFKETNFVTRAMPIEGKKSDPAHPSISPTGEFDSLSGEEKKIYELIVKRFISCFCADALIENKTITAVSEGLVFKERGLEIGKKGWMEVYDTKLQEKELRDMTGLADITQVDIEKDETKPPKRYSPASIISELEKRGLGTKATRSSIIETLYDRGYIEDNKSIRATPIGINLIDTLGKYSPIIIDEKLTKDMEKDLDSLRLAKKDLDKKQLTILHRAQHSLKDISEDFKKKELNVGRELIKAEAELWKRQNLENELDFECPKCKKGKFIIKYSPRFKRKFIGCTNYPQCNLTFGLPMNSFLKKTDKFCEYCKFPLLMSLKKARRPWIFCFNPECESRKNKTEQTNSESEESAEKEKEED